MILTPKDSKNAVADTLKEVKERQLGLKKGILTPFPKLNKYTGGFQPAQSYMIAAGSGVGKTTFINIVEEKLFEMNKGRKILVLSWCLEISSTMTLLKKTSSNLGIELDSMLSFNEPITEEMYGRIQDAVKKYEKQPIYYFEQSSTCADIEDTIYHYHGLCKEKENKLGEKWEILVLLDHTLLVEKQKNQNNNDLVADIGKMSIKTKKDTGCTFIFLGQLNGNQEKLDRLQNPTFHAPIKDDLYGGKEIWHALDWVGIMVRPDLLGLESYTLAELPCTDRMYLHFIKSRFGQLGYTCYDTSKLGINKLIEL